MFKVYAPCRKSTKSSRDEAVLVSDASRVYNAGLEAIVGVNAGMKEKLCFSIESGSFAVCLSGKYP